MTLWSIFLFTSVPSDKGASVSITELRSLFSCREPDVVRCCVRDAITIVFTTSTLTSVVLNGSSPVLWPKRAHLCFDQSAFDRRISFKIAQLPRHVVLVRKNVPQTQTQGTSGHKQTRSKKKKEKKKTTRKKKREKKETKKRCQCQLWGGSEAADPMEPLCWCCGRLTTSPGSTGFC